MLMAVAVPPPPWTWWMRSPIVRLLLTDPRYDNGVKRALQSIMSTRHRLTKNANQHHHHRPRASVP